jgi:hypothetical protein
MKIYELLIPSWNAAIPEDWDLEFAHKAGDEFRTCAGEEILIMQGARLRGGPPELIENMLSQNYIREVEE